MDPLTTGRFLTQRRREKNLTQEQLAERIGVSNKTISKWETGKCMPDYSIAERLCRELDITLAELISGETDEKSIHTYDGQAALEMQEKTRRRRRMKLGLFGGVLLAAGIAKLILSQALGGTEVQDALSGLLIGIAAPELAAGAVAVCIFLIKERRRVS